MYIVERSIIIPKGKNLSLTYIFTLTYIFIYMTYMFITDIYIYKLTYIFINTHIYS